MDITVRLILEAPNLEHVGEKVVDALDRINSKIDELVATVNQELTEIADALHNAAPSQEAVDATVERLEALRLKVADAVTPDPPPAP